MANKKLKVSNVPNLRFPGFNEEWETKKLVDITIKVNSGKTPLGGEKAYKASGVHFIRSQNVNNGRLQLENSVFISESTNAEMKNSVVQANDILLNITGASLGRSCVVPRNFKIGNVNQHVCIIRFKDNYDPRFVEPIMASEKGQLTFKSLQTGSGREGLNFESIKGISLDLPEIKEQKKIASFLSLLDERIATQSKIIEELKTQMQGFHKKLFSQQFRFKDSNGNYFPDWENKSLLEVCQKKSSNLSANKIEDNFGKYIIYGAAGVLKKIDFYEEENDYIGIVKDGAGVGRLFYCKEKSSVLGTMDIIKPLANTDVYFLFYLLSNIDFTKYVTGSTIPHIYFRDYKNENIEIPSIEEQTKIADFLSSVDTKIDNEIHILHKLEEQKKYLLQNLFI
ncbi:hypothetical protein ACM46_09930 [Chryseobacterium angstadtii]|uniref:Type I restriction modification DNA specificity domain-containing protein n=1 Tax=Chryseobacterium angstadtii TaxID=558151 RepID=A0A0J7IDQ7_9FLAO|nr:restriction endonuclease subunit S [Chryseobacterium angstadtii]KMQ64568.1 hypothetical protein ACM46_09930 [Chryseobacterium angstadtii]